MCVYRAWNTAGGYPQEPPAICFPYISAPAVLSLILNRAVFSRRKKKLRAAAIFAKTGKAGFVLELFLGGGSLGYVNSILYL